MTTILSKVTSLKIVQSKLATYIKDPVILLAILMRWGHVGSFRLNDKDREALLRWILSNEDENRDGRDEDGDDATLKRHLRLLLAYRYNSVSTMSLSTDMDSYSLSEKTQNVQSEIPHDSTEVADFSARARKKRKMKEKSNSSFQTPSVRGETHARAQRRLVLLTGMAATEWMEMVCFFSKV